MSFLYHVVPKEMQGETLYPTNMLKDKHPKIYKKDLKEDKGRENIFEKRIPPLKCDWDDVVHLIAVHPKKIKEALEKAGYEMDKPKWYQIPAKMLDPKKTIVYLYKNKNDLINMTTSDQFVKFSASGLAKYDKIPKDTFEYYKQAVEEGRKPLIYHFIPHVFYKDALDISDVKIIKI